MQERTETTMTLGATTEKISYCSFVSASVAIDRKRLEIEICKTNAVMAEQEQHNVSSCNLTTPHPLSMRYHAVINMAH